MLTANSSEILQLREDLRRLQPPYLLRKYDATQEDYDSIADEDLRCEFIDGVLIVHSPASVHHEERLVFLATLVNMFAASKQLGRVFGSNTVMELGQRRLCPDLSFLRTDHADRIQRGRVVGPMDLVIEMVSKSTRDYDLGERRNAYHEGRIPEIWFIDAELKQCQIDQLEDDTYSTRTLTTGRFTSRILPGLSLEVAWFWSDPPPNPLECLKVATGGV